MALNHLTLNLAKDCTSRAIVETNSFVYSATTCERVSQRSLFWKKTAETTAVRFGHFFRHRCRRCRTNFSWNIRWRYLLTSCASHAYLWKWNTFAFCELMWNTETSYAAYGTTYIRIKRAHTQLKHTCIRSIHSSRRENKIMALSQKRSHLLLANWLLEISYSGTLYYLFRSFWFGRMRNSVNTRIL